MLNFFISFFSYCIEYYVAVSFFNNMLTQKRNKATTYGVSAIVYLTCCICFLYISNAAINFAIFLIANLAISVFLYRGKPAFLVLYPFVLSAVMVVCEYMTMILLSLGTGDIEKYKTNNAMFTVMVIISKLLYVTIIKIISYIGERITEKEIRTPMFLFIFPTCTIIILYSFWLIETSDFKGSNLHNIIIISTVSLTLSVILTYIFYTKTTTELQRLYIENREKEKIEIEKTYFDIIESQNNKLREFMHDEKNHLETIKTLADGTDACPYIDEIYGEIKKISTTGNTGNRVLNLIINKYEIICSEKQIDFDFSAKDVNLNYISDSNLISLMTNILDNACEAAEKTETPYIDLRLGKSNGFDILVCSNPFSEIIKTQGDMPVTTKTDKTLHGYGIKNIKRVVKNYHGDIKWQIKDNIFEVSIVFAPRKLNNNTDLC